MGTYRGWGDAEVHGPYPPKRSSAHKSRALIPLACILEDMGSKRDTSHFCYEQAFGCSI